MKRAKSERDTKSQTKRQTVTDARETPAEQRPRPRWLVTAVLLMLICGMAGFTSSLVGASIALPAKLTEYEVVDTNHPFYASSATGSEAAQSTLSPVFTAEVQYWEPLIRAWGIMYQVDPNVIATLIQIESCGDPQVSSPAGAQGLFQVMPFHFATGEDMLDVQTNARRGMDYLLEGLRIADGHVGLALAGYNGGHGIINRGWASWMPETQRYYYWSSRIYTEATSGMAASPTLQEWLSAGGQSLCNRAGDTQRRLEAQNQQQQAVAQLPQ